MSEDDGGFFLGLPRNGILEPICGRLSNRNLEIDIFAHKESSQTGKLIPRIATLGTLSGNSKFNTTESNTIVSLAADFVARLFFWGFDRIDAVSSAGVFDLALWCFILHRVLAFDMTDLEFSSDINNITASGMVCVLGVLVPGSGRTSTVLGYPYWLPGRQHFLMSVLEVRHRRVSAVVQIPVLRTRYLYCRLQQVSKLPCFRGLGERAPRIRLLRGEMFMKRKYQLAHYAPVRPLS